MKVVVSFHAQSNGLVIDGTYTLNLSNDIASTPDGLHLKVQSEIVQAIRNLGQGNIRGVKVEFKPVEIPR